MLSSWNHYDERFKKNTVAMSSSQSQIEETIESEELYRLLFQNSNDAMFVSLRKLGDVLPGKIIAVNDIAIQRLGYTRDEFLQMTPLDFSAPLSAIPQKMKLLARDKHVIHEQIHIAKNGREIPVEISSRSFELSGKQVNLSVARDISERKQVEETLQLQGAALKAAANAIVITDLEGTILWINPAWSEMTGYTNEEAIGQNHRMLKSGVQGDAFYKELWDTILSGKVWQRELVNKRKDGSFYTEEQTITPVCDAKGQVTHFIAIKLDISERKKMEEKLKQLSIHDMLTGLYNRSFFQEKLNKLERGRNFPIGLVMADVDHLKRVNDLEGHAVGDELLKSTAQLLMTAFRIDDIVARIGGDEFAVILPNTDERAAEIALHRVRRSVQKYNNDHKGGIQICISFGVSIAIDNSIPLDEVLKKADAKMYHEKQTRYRGGRCNNLMFSIGRKMDDFWT